MNTTHNAPEAEVVKRSGSKVTVLCPLCGNRHTHSLTVPHGYQRMAPLCGMFRSQEDRLNGYWFITK